MPIPPTDGCEKLSRPPAKRKTAREKPLIDPDVLQGDWVATERMEVEEGPAPAAKSIGITEDTKLSLGYALLRQYKLVRDFRLERIYLLAR